MFSKHEAVGLRKSFWTAFGQYMKPVQSADGEQISWLNYRTGHPYVLIKTEAEDQTASVWMELTHPDSQERQRLLDLLRSLKDFFPEPEDHRWTWQQDVVDEKGRTRSRIIAEISGVHILKKDDWPEMISFLKSGLITLDQFWTTVRYYLDDQ